MSAAPDPELREVLRGQHPIVVLAPHPDDESLGCGILLSRAFAGKGAHVICLTDGSASHLGSAQWPAAKLAECRSAEMTNAVIQLGGTADDLTWCGYPDARLYRLDPGQVARDLLPIITASGARHVFAPAMEDHHEDHKATATFALALRKLRPDLKYYSYPVWCRWDDPDFSKNVERHNPVHLRPGTWRAQKRAAITAHRSQMGLVVQDDPTGFVMPAAFIDAFVNGSEIFWRQV